MANKFFSLETACYWFILQKINHAVKKKKKQE